VASANAQGFANQLDRQQSRQNRQDQAEIGHVDSDNRNPVDVGNLVNSSDDIIIDPSVNDSINDSIDDSIDDSINDSINDNNDNNNDNINDNNRIDANSNDVGDMVDFDGNRINVDETDDKRLEKVYAVFRSARRPPGAFDIPNSQIRRNGRNGDASQQHNNINHSVTNDVSHPNHLEMLKIRYCPGD
jgi:hypothetical protein